MNREEPIIAQDGWSRMAPAMNFNFSGDAERAPPIPLRDALKRDSLPKTRALRLTHSRLTEVMAFSDRLRQPDNLSKERGSFTKTARFDTLFRETHGFAPLPRGRFAFIVCNHRFAKDHRYCQRL